MMPDLRGQLRRGLHSPFDFSRSVGPPEFFQVEEILQVQPEPGIGLALVIEPHRQTGSPPLQLNRDPSLDFVIICS